MDAHAQAHRASSLAEPITAPQSPMAGSDSPSHQGPPGDTSSATSLGQDKLKTQQERLQVTEQSVQTKPRSQATQTGCEETPRHSQGRLDVANLLPLERTRERFQDKSQRPSQSSNSCDAHGTRRSPRLPLQLLLQGFQPLLPLKSSSSSSCLATRRRCTTPPPAAWLLKPTPRPAPRPPPGQPHPPPGPSRTAPSASETALASGHPRPSAQTSADLQPSRQPPDTGLGVGGTQATRTTELTQDPGRRFPGMDD
ncbi:hypothetical protein Cadr_000017654 [Camelus dromedarius]|uniref:Uncharacterized protein n=1 Tax=Camelus dromedarius TaxID=9838 RepID=A0A5N4DGV1_CAMDR|nr:hypothetical protein Cadr_000017654 [Camelus dromedarius]